METLYLISSIISVIILFLVVNSLYKTMKATEKIKIYTFMQTKVIIEIAEKQGIMINRDEIFREANKA
jgi:hypothetical protein